MFAWRRSDGAASRISHRVLLNSTTCRSDAPRKNCARPFGESICRIVRTFGMKIGRARSVAKATAVITMSSWVSRRWRVFNDRGVVVRQATALSIFSVVDCSTETETFFFSFDLPISERFRATGERLVAIIDNSSRNFLENSPLTENSLDALTKKSTFTSGHRKSFQK